MTPDAKRELATAILETIRVHEESYEGDFKYALSWGEAAQRTCKDPDLVDLVCSMCCAGYVDFPEWAEGVLAKSNA
jgi:hypothetical protein